MNTLTPTDDLSRPNTMDGRVHSVLRGLNIQINTLTPTDDLSRPNKMDGRVHSVLKRLNNYISGYPDYGKCFGKVWHVRGVRI